MKLPAFALFERTLRLESRSALMCWSRVGLLVMILFMLFPIQSLAGAGWYGAPGLRFLQEMIWANLVFITFASAITEEKEEMMLGLLRMTDLNGVAILLGKSTSRLVGALLLLLVQVPFVLLAVTLGGVGLLQIIAAYGTLLAYLFLLCNLALLFSVLFRNTTTAAALAFFLMLLFFFGHYWAAGIEQGLASYYHVNLQHGVWPTVNNALDIWRRTTPTDQLAAIFRTGFTGPALGFQVASNLTLGVIFFLLAWLVFDVCTREEKDAAPVRRWFLGRKTRRSRIPPGLKGARAVTWKDFTFVGGGRVGLLLKFAVVGLLVAGCNALAWESNERITFKFESAVLIWISLVSTAVWLALDAARIFRDEIRWKTWSSLMTLPMSLHELAYRKVLGALVATLPLLAFFVVGVLLDSDKIGDFIDSIFREPSAFGMLAVAFFQYILFLHLTAFLSLILKRGALPLAIAIQYLGGSFFLGIISAFLMVTGFGGFIVFVAFICLVLTAVLHRAIGYRLARAAAEE
jgi:hypothetical protein